MASKPKKKTGLVSNKRGAEEQQLYALASELVGRAALAAKLGKSFGTTRDIYTALGYTKTPVFSDYKARYDRQDVAKRLIDAPVVACWKDTPTVTENEEKETVFEKEWIALCKKRKVFHYLSRVDKLSGIGRYGVLLLGFNDGGELSQPVISANKLLYTRPYTEENAVIKSWVEDTKDERFGLPLLYDVKVSNTNNSSKTLVVHYSRILHIAGGLEENDVYGTPELKCVLNRLQDLELVAGGSAEMFWRGALPGYGFVVDKDADMSKQAMAALEEEIEEYVHNLRRYIRAQGMTIENLAQQVADPKGHVDVLLDLIAGAKGIPRRILVGSERGELASTQDEKNWNNKIDERRKNQCELLILRPFIDRLIEFGVLTEPTEEYTIEWSDLFAPSEKEKADVSKILTEALAAYTSSVGADQIVPVKIFLKRFLGFTEEEVIQIEEEIDLMMKEDVNELEEEPIDDGTLDLDSSGEVEE